MSKITTKKKKEKCYARNSFSLYPQPSVLPGTAAAILSAITSPQENNFGFAAENVLIHFMVKTLA